MYEGYCYLDPTVSGKFEYECICFLYKPVYVGKGNIHHKRKYKHLTHASNKRLYHKLQQLANINLMPVILTIDTFDHEVDALNYEIQLITTIGREDIGTGYLYNFTNGGEGVSGRRVADEQLQQKSVYKSNWWRQLTKEQKQAIVRKSHNAITSEHQKQINEQLSKTYYSKSVEVRAEIERKRYKSWNISYHARSAEDRRITSLRCSAASKKAKRVPRVFFTLKNAETNEEITKSQYDWHKDGIDSTVLRNRIRNPHRVIKNNKTKSSYLFVSASLS